MPTRTPIITRERYHERINALGDDVVYTPAAGASVKMHGIVDRAQYEIGASDSGISFATQGATRLTISDIAFRTLDADSQALMTLDNLVGTASAANGQFLFRGEAWLLAGVESLIDSGHILAHKYTLARLSSGMGPIQPPSATPDVYVDAGTSADFSYNADSRATNVTRVSGPVWVSSSGVSITFSPPSDIVADDGDYTFAFTGFSRSRYGEVFTYATQNFLVRVRAAITPPM